LPLLFLAEQNRQFCLGSAPLLLKATIGASCHSDGRTCYRDRLVARLHCGMIQKPKLDRFPEPLNATEFMHAVIALAPHEAELFVGPVTVEVLVDINEQGLITHIEARHENEKLRSAAQEAVQCLRFAPAMRSGRAIAYPNYGITVRFRPKPLDVQ
jgi:hypothetical protein